MIASAASSKIRSPKVIYLFFFTLNLMQFILNCVFFSIDILDRPRLSNQMPFIIDDLFIYLYPNVTKFESDMCKLISEDKSTWNKIDIEPSIISIFERRLKIGIHNGWKFVSQPYIIHLSVDEQLTSTKQFQQQLSNTIQQQLKAKRLSLKSSIKPPKATDSEMDNSK